MTSETAEEVIAATRHWLETAVIGLDLCLHLLREESVAQAVAAVPDAAQIYEKNILTLRRLGHAGWKRLGI